MNVQTSPTLAEKYVYPFHMRGPNTNIFLRPRRKFPHVWRPGSWLLPFVMVWALKNSWKIPIPLQVSCTTEPLCSVDLSLILFYLNRNRLHSALFLTWRLRLLLYNMISARRRVFTDLFSAHGVLTRTSVPRREFWQWRFWAHGLSLDERRFTGTFGWRTDF